MTHRAAMLYQEAKMLKHGGPCGPIALSILTDQSYIASAELCAEKGSPQEGKGGVFAQQILTILHELGYAVSDITDEARDLGAKTIQSMGWVLKKDFNAPGEKLLIQTRNHFAAVKDGVIHDWSSGRKMHIVRLYRIEVSE